MMGDEDSIEAARTNEAAFSDVRVSHFWDPERLLGGLVAKTLLLKKTAWDIYMLYDRGILWEGATFPQPFFWMAQLPSEWGLPMEKFLDPGSLAQTVSRLTGKADGRSAVDARLHFHLRGLIEMM
ncbi:MAG: hypothetical protein GXP53_07975 [Deltaproteobacteria bacterium]|nr:hypothetical protein [Deltaproteobacteria bacterium]